MPSDVFGSKLQAHNSVYPLPNGQNLNDFTYHLLTPLRFVMDALTYIGNQTGYNEILKQNIENFQKMTSVS